MPSNIRQQSMSLRICSGFAPTSGPPACAHVECPNGYPHIRVQQGQCPLFVSELGCEDPNCVLDHRELTQEEFHRGLAGQQKRIFISRAQKAAGFQQYRQQPQPQPHAFQQHYNAIPQQQQQQPPFAQGAPLAQDHNYFTNHIKFLQSLPDCTKYIYKLCWDVAKLGNTAPQSIVFCDFPTRHVYSLPLDLGLAHEILAEGLAAATRKRQPTWWTGVLPVSVEDAQYEYNTAITKVFYSEADYAKDLARMAFVPQAPVQQPNQHYVQAPFPGQQQQQQQPQQPQQPPRPSFNQPFGQQPGPQQQQYQQPPPHPQQQYQQQPQYPQQQQYQQQPQYPQQQQYQQQQYQQYQQGPAPGQYQQP